MTGRHKTQRRAWTEDEALWLQELAGDMPFPVVHQQFNKWAKRNGIPMRSADSLHKKLRKLGISRRAEGMWICSGDVARMLGKDRSTIQNWCSAGLLRRHRAGRFTSVSREDLIGLAHERPRLFAGCDRSNLLLLLEDEDLVDGILQRFPRRHSAAGHGRRVRWVDTGQVFNTYREAGIAAHVSDKTICKALHQGRLACGLRFEFAD